MKQVAQTLQPGSSTLQQVELFWHQPFEQFCKTKLLFFLTFTFQDQAVTQRCLSESVRFIINNKLYLPFFKYCLYYQGKYSKVVIFQDAKENNNLHFPVVHKKHVAWFCCKLHYNTSLRGTNNSLALSLHHPLSGCHQLVIVYVTYLLTAMKNEPYLRIWFINQSLMIFKNIQLAFWQRGNVPSTCILCGRKNNV